MFEQHPKDERVCYGVDNQAWGWGTSAFQAGAPCAKAQSRRKGDTRSWWHVLRSGSEWVKGPEAECWQRDWDKWADESVQQSNSPESWREGTQSHMGNAGRWESRTPNHTWQLSQWKVARGEGSRFLRNGTGLCVCKNTPPKKCIAELGYTQLTD